MIISGVTLTGGRYGTLNIVQNNLQLLLDAGDPASYPGSGSTWTDTVGNLTFSLMNDPVYNDHQGGSLVFNPASSQYADGPSLASSLSTWTVETWLLHDATNMGTGGSPCIVTELYFGNPINFTVGNTQDAFPNVQAGSFLGSWAATALGITLVSGNWYQVVGTWDGTNMALYINGQLGSSQAWPGFISTRGGNGIRLMGRWDNAQFWGGRLSIVRIYGVDIGSAGVAQNFAATRSRFGI